MEYEICSECGGTGRVSPDRGSMFMIGFVLILMFFSGFWFTVGFMASSYLGGVR